MKNKNTNNKPWLDSFGNTLPEAQLKNVSSSWDGSTWEEYIKHFESSQNEFIGSEDIASARRTSNIESSFKGASTNPIKVQQQRLIRRALKTLTKMQRKVLKKNIFYDLSQAEIASKLRISEAAVFYHREAAIKSLSVHPELLNFLHLMKEGRIKRKKTKEISEIFEVYNLEIRREVL